MKQKKILITGLGVVSPSGIGKKEFWNNVVGGVNAISGTKDLFSCVTNTKSVGVVKNYDPTAHFSPKERSSYVRFSQFGILSAKLALADANLAEKDLKNFDPYRRGVILGTTTAGLDFMLDQHKIFQKQPNDIHPFTFSASVPNACASLISILANAKGPCKVFGSACAAANDAIGYGMQLIRLGICDMVIAGGSDSPIHPMVIDACYKGGIASRVGTIAPFDKNRDGTILGEGGAMLILEEEGHAIARNAKVYAELSGYGTTCDAHHIVRLPEDGMGVAMAIDIALKDAKVKKNQVGYINAHGTGTIPNDIVETKAIKSVFDLHAYKLSVSSTKSMMGHLQGAAGAVEALATVMTVYDGIMPPTINYVTPDPRCDLDYVPNVARKKNINVAISQNCGFGGINSVLVFKKYN